MPPKMSSGERATVAAIAWIVYGGSIILHEWAHVAAGVVVGGHPTLISTTDVQGDWSGVSAAGMTVIGLGGAAVNVALALLALLLLRSAWIRTEAMALFAWLLLAVNGFIVSVYLIVSPLLGFGDWSTILRQFGHPPILRVLAALTGALLTFLWFRVVARRAPLLVGSVPPGHRVERGQQLVLTSWLSGGALGVAAALLSPLGWGWAIPIAAGATMGTTWPMLPAAGAGTARTLPEAPSPVRPLRPSTGWILAGVAVAGVFVLGFGPGISLSGDSGMAAPASHPPAGRVDCRNGSYLEDSCGNLVQIDRTS